MRNIVLLKVIEVGQYRINLGKLHLIGPASFLFNEPA